MRTRLIVPGASGFIGRNLLRASPPDWEVVALYNTKQDLPSWCERMNLKHVTAARCDLTNDVAVRGLAESLGPRFDHSVFLAANGDPAYSVTHPLEDLQANAVTLLNFLNSFEVGKLVYFSSGAVYDGSHGPVSPAAPVSPTQPGIESGKAPAAIRPMDVACESRLATPACHHGPR